VIECEKALNYISRNNHRDLLEMENTHTHTHTYKWRMNWNERKFSKSHKLNDSFAKARDYEKDSRWIFFS
jgi:hypothetical protein